MTALSVIIPAATDAPRLAWTLEGLCHQTRQDFEVIVALDSKPGRGTHKAVREVCDRYRERLAQRQIPFVCVALGKRSSAFRAAATRNLGAKHSQGEVLLFLDADCVPLPGLVAGHLERLQQCGPNTVVQGARRMLPQDVTEALAEALGSLADLTIDNRAWTGTVAALWEHATPFYGRGHARIETLMSFSFSLHAEMFLRAGGFREEYEGWGGEDQALGRDLARLGAIATEFFDEPLLPDTNPDVVHLNHEPLPFNPANISAERVSMDAEIWPRARLERIERITKL